MAMKEKKKVIDEECYWHSLASVGAEGHKCREDEKAHWEKQVVQQDFISEYVFENEDSGAEQRLPWAS